MYKEGYATNIRAAAVEHWHRHGPAEATPTFKVMPVEHRRFPS
jgi:hypothetical protein